MDRPAGHSRKKQKRLVRMLNSRWPPRKGDLVYFKTEEGVQSGRFREARQGLVWMDFVLMDGRVIPEDDVITCPKPTPWRDPDTVSKDEQKEWAGQVRSKLEAGIDPTRDQRLMADFVHYGMFVLLQIRKGDGLDNGEPVLGSPPVEQLN